MDPVFEQEQEHLTRTHAQLTDIVQKTQASLEARLKEALNDKTNMLDELALDFGNEVDVETYAEIESMHKIIDAYNLSQDVETERLQKATLLLKQPYFAKISLRYKPGAAPRDIYIGACGITSDEGRYFIIDWRSPVAEVYYNQESGMTSYEANGRTIDCELVCRRQFDITSSTLNSYFDTTIAIEDPLLLASLAKSRDAKLSDITATIQREQNLVIRHEDVPVLLVNGIAGSGKTSVLLQRIAYLLFQERETLDPRDVWLITPNEVFADYISNVLPEMGETNPRTTTWAELMHSLELDVRGLGHDNSTATLQAIDERLEHYRLDDRDFQDICIDGERVISASTARNVWNKFAKFPTGEHRSSLVVDVLLERLEQRIARLSVDEDMQNLVSELDDQEQYHYFGQQVAMVEEEELKKYTRIYLEKRYEGIEQRILDGEWLRMERIGMRLLGKESLTSAEWLYLRLAIMGGGQRRARFVMIDEVQDYTAPQLMVLARYFANAHFLLLGDENQAINEGTATFEQIKDIFTAAHGEVSTCELMTSYRSTPEITELFCSLMAPDERLKTSSVQRAGAKPCIEELEGDDAYRAALRDAVRQAANSDGIAAVIVAHAGLLKQTAALLEGLEFVIPDAHTHLPSSGVVLIDIHLAKGLEFDEVIICDASKRLFGEDAVSRHRLYTAASRATQRLTILSKGEKTALLS